MEIVVALALLLASAIVIYDSARLGFSWLENEGPASGYFPFYIALIMAGSSLVTLIRAILARDGAGSESFVSKTAFLRVLAVLIPALVFVAVIQVLGLYIASAMFITAFMLTLGRESIIKSVIIGISVPLALFVLFEIWFLVPLPKGPVEHFFGY
jgi:hypothetical protein